MHAYAHVKVVASCASCGCSTDSVQLPCRVWLEQGLRPAALLFRLAGLRTPDSAPQAFPRAPSAIGFPLMSLAPVRVGY